MAKEVKRTGGDTNTGTSSSYPIFESSSTYAEVKRIVEDANSSNIVIRIGRDANTSTFSFQPRFDYPLPTYITVNKIFRAK